MVCICDHTPLVTSVHDQIFPVTPPWSIRSYHHGVDHFDICDSFIVDFTRSVSVQYETGLRFYSDSDENWPSDQVSRVSLMNSSKYDAYDDDVIFLQIWIVSLQWFDINSKSTTSPSSHLCTYVNKHFDINLIWNHHFEWIRRHSSCIASYSIYFVIRLQLSSFSNNDTFTLWFCSLLKN